MSVACVSAILTSRMICTKHAVLSGLPELYSCHRTSCNFIIHCHALQSGCYEQPQHACGLHLYIPHQVHPLCCAWTCCGAVVKHLQAVGVGRRSLSVTRSQGQTSGYGAGQFTLPQLRGLRLKSHNSGNLADGMLAAGSPTHSI